MATLVLIPGFWLGAWAWEEVAGNLRAAGHDVHPVTLTGQADRQSEATPAVNVSTQMADIVRTIEQNGLHDVILVGHSGANMPVTGAADQLPARIRRTVYVDTGPMPSGMAWIEFKQPREQQELRDEVAELGDGWRIPVPPFDPVADPINLAGLSDTQLARLRAMATPQPFGTATQPLNRPTPPPVPASLVISTFTPEQVHALARGGNPIFGLMSEMDMHALPTGHWPMFSRPADLAAILDEIATNATVPEAKTTRRTPH